MATLTATVLTPTIATDALADAVRSVARQQPIPGVDIRHIVVADGKRYENAARDIALKAWEGIGHTAKVFSVPDNTHAGEWYGHRIYGHYSQLLETEYLFFLDEDNAYEPDHIASLMPIAQQHGFAWSRRKVAINGELIGNDDFEAVGAVTSLGYRLVDTSCWGFRRDHIGDALATVGKWGADRQLTNHVALRYGERALLDAGTGLHTVIYNAPERLGDFFRRHCTRA